MLAAAVSILIAINSHFPIFLNDTSSISACPSVFQSDVILVLSNFSNPDYFSVTAIRSNGAVSTMISLVQSIQPVLMTYQGNVSLQQTKNLLWYVLPDSLFILNFSFDGQMDKNLTVQFRKYDADAHPGQLIRYNQYVGPSTMSHSVNYTAAESGYLEVMIINNEGLTGNYSYNFSIKELHNIELEYNCSVNFSISTCTMSPTLLGQNILLGLPEHDNESDQCQPIVDVFLTGLNTNTITVTIIISLSLVVLLYIVLLIYVMYMLFSSTCTASLHEHTLPSSSPHIANSPSPSTTYYSATALSRTATVSSTTYHTANSRSSSFTTTTFLKLIVS